MDRPGFSRFVEFAPGKKVANAGLPVPFAAIEERTDIISRNIAGANDTIESMAYEAARELLYTLNIKPADCGGLVLASCAVNEGCDHGVSGIAKIVANQLGIHNADIRGVNFACSGFPAAVKSALSISETTDRHILVITAEIMSRLIDWSEESTAVLFGDRAAATSIISGGHEILEADAWNINDAQSLIYFDRIDDAMNIDGERARRRCMRMKGKALYKRAPSDLVSLIRNSMQKNSLEPADVSAIIPHQANGRFMTKIQDVLQRNGEDKDQWKHVWVVNQIDHMANVGASSIPCALAQIQDYLLVGKTVLCPSIGAGSDFERGQLTEGILTFRISQ